MCHQRKRIVQRRPPFRRLSRSLRLYRAALASLAQRPSATSVSTICGRRFFHGPRPVKCAASASPSIGERAARVAQHIGSRALPGECSVAIGRDAVLRQIKGTPAEHAQVHHLQPLSLACDFVDLSQTPMITRRYSFKRVFEGQSNQPAIASHVRVHFGRTDVRSRGISTTSCLMVPWGDNAPSPW